MQQFNSQNIVSNGRKIRTAAGSAAVALIQTAKLNGGGPRAWLADVRGRIADHNSQRLDQPLSWNRKSSRTVTRRLSGSLRLHPMQKYFAAAGYGST